jgi:hypothetical protein
MSTFTGMVTRLTFGTMSFSDPDHYFGISIMLKDLGRDKEYPCNMPANLNGQSLSGYVFLLTTAMINGYLVETTQDDDGYTTGVRILPL